MTLRLGIDVGGTNTDAVVLVLNNKNNAKYSENEDAIDIGGNGALVSMSALSADSVNLSINRLPLPGRTRQIVPLAVNAATAGLYTLNLTELENLPSNYQVWLKDLYNKDSLDMRANSSYSFNIDKANAETFGRNRFQLAISQNPGQALSLLDLRAAKISGGARLSWVTANEGDAANFTVERSINDGKTFEVIGTLQPDASGKYSMIDEVPVTGKNQFRLRQDDINGGITYSNVVDLMYARTSDKINANNLSVFPNPASAIINLVITPEANETNASSYTIQISNGNGKVVKTAVSSQPNWQNNVSYLLPGTYFVKVINNATKTIVGNSKFVKL